MKKKMSRLDRRNIVVSILLGLFCLLWIYPFVWPIFSSFKSSAEMYRAGWHLWPKDWTVENYIRAWSKANFSKYMLNSIFYSISSTLISVTSSALAGYAFARYNFPGRKWIRLIVMGMVFLPTSTSILPVFDLMQRLHLLNSPFAVILALSGSVGFSAMLFEGYFRNIPRDLYDAMEVDGASFFQQIRITLPLAKPVISTSVIMAFNASWQEYFIPLVFTLGKPELRTLAVGLRSFTGQYSSDTSGFAAATTISIIPIVIVFILFQRQFVDGLAGSVKG